MRDKKLKWSKNRKRLRDALESNAHNNQIEQMFENFYLLKPEEFNTCKDKLLFLSLKNCSKNCATFLIEHDAKCDLNKVFNECSWKSIHNVYELLLDIYGPDVIGFGIGNKRSLISRLIDPSKVEANIERAEYVFKLLKDGFFSVEDIRHICNLLYKDKNEKGNIKMILRELTLNELGI